MVRKSSSFLLRSYQTCVSSTEPICTSCHRPLDRIHPNGLTALVSRNWYHCFSNTLAYQPMHAPTIPQEEYHHMSESIWSTSRDRLYHTHYPGHQSKLPYHPASSSLSVAHAALCKKYSRVRKLIIKIAYLIMNIIFQ